MQFSKFWFRGGIYLRPLYCFVIYINCREFWNFWIFEKVERSPTLEGCMGKKIKEM